MLFPLSEVCPVVSLVSSLPYLSSHRFQLGFGFLWNEHVVGDAGNLLCFAPDGLQYMQLTEDRAPFLFFVQCHFQRDPCRARQ